MTYNEIAHALVARLEEQKIRYEVVKENIDENGFDEWYDAQRSVLESEILFIEQLLGKMGR